MGCSQSSTAQPKTSEHHGFSGISERLQRRVGRSRKRAGDPHPDSAGEAPLSFIAEEPEATAEQRVVFVDVVLLGPGAASVVEIACEEMMARVRSQPDSGRPSLEASPPGSPSNQKEAAAAAAGEQGIPSERNPISAGQESTTEGPDSPTSAEYRTSRLPYSKANSNRTVGSRSTSAWKRSSYLHLQDVTVRTRMWPIEKSEMHVPTFPKSQNGYVAYVLMCPVWAFDMMECCLWKLCLNRLLSSLKEQADKSDRQPYVKFIPVVDNRSPDTSAEGSTSTLTCEKWLANLGIPQVAVGVIPDLGKPSSLADILVRKVAEDLVHGQGLLSNRSLKTE
mmetsp:Transcript_10057/g.22596  ORF Transcript_10057/g.22596 Transcript_10057/m.22596 type:complete len:336 (+) Transcript_10057:98-1105(+)